MGKNNKQNRAKNKRKRLRAVGRARPRPPDLPADTIYSDEPDMKVLCPHCGVGSMVPVHATRLSRDADFTEMGLHCPACRQSFPVQPRREVAPDGSLLLWVDESVVGEYIDPEVIDYVTLQHRETGDVVTFTRSREPNVAWAVCDDCGLPFKSTGDVAISTASEAQLVPDLMAFPCEHCGGMGHTLTFRSERDGVITYANSPGFGDLVLQEHSSVT